MAKKLLFASVATLLLATHVAQSEPRYSIEGIIGKADQINSGNGLPTISAYESSKGIRTTAMLSNNIALEIAYFDFGEAAESYIDSFSDTITDTLDTNSLNVGLQGAFGISPVVSLTGRVGLALWEFEFSETDSGFPGQIYRDDDQGVDAYYGVGMQFDVSPTVRLSLDYTVLDFSPKIGAVSTDHEIENLSLSAGIRF